MENTQQKPCRYCERLHAEMAALLARKLSIRDEISGKILGPAVRRKELADIQIAIDGALGKISRHDSVCSRDPQAKPTEVSLYENRLGSA